MEDSPNYHVAAAPLATGGGETGFVVLPAEARAKLKMLAGHVLEEFSGQGWEARQQERCGVVSVRSNQTLVLVNPNFGPTSAGLLLEYIAAASPEIALGTLAYVEHLEAHAAALTTRLQEAEAEKQTNLDKWGEYEHRLRNELQRQIGEELEAVNKLYASKFAEAERHLQEAEAANGAAIREAVATEELFMAARKEQEKRGALWLARAEKAEARLAEEQATGAEAERQLLLRDEENRKMRSLLARAKNGLDAFGVGRASRPSPAEWAQAKAAAEALSEELYAVLTVSPAPLPLREAEEPQEGGQGA